MVNKLYPKKNWIRILIAGIVLILLVLWAGGLYLSSHFEDIVRKKVSEQLPESITVNFKSLKINMFTRSLAVEELKVMVAGEVCTSDSLSIAEIAFEGISLTNLLFNNTLSINSLKIRDVNAVLHQSCIDKTSSQEFSNSKSNIPFATAEIDVFNLVNSEILYQDSESSKVNSTVASTIENIKIPINNGRPDFSALQIGNVIFNASNVAFTEKQGFYNTKVKGVHINSKKRIAVVDSLLIVPLYDKFEFGHKYGKQADRMEAVIPNITVNNFLVKKMADSSFVASSLHIYSPSLKSFRDKRLPRIKPHPSPLPSEMLNRIPFTISIDTICIHEASIVYEEFPDNSHTEQSGKIWFSNLGATAYNVTNQKASERSAGEFIDVDVEANFMNAGKLSVSFDIPYRSGKPHHVKGSLKDFELTSLNPTLKNLSMIEVKSGTMNLMSFHFSYNNRESTGEVELNYEKLKVVSLQQKKEVERIHELKTFLLNLFIKNNKDARMPKDKRSGTIHFVRDPKKSIFNYLWKSLLSGIKNSYNMEDVLSFNNDKAKSRKRKNNKK